MEVIKVTIEYDGEVTLCDEYTTRGPLTLNWFMGNDLKVIANGKTVTLNTDKTTAGGTYRLPSGLFN